MTSTLTAGLTWMMSAMGIDLPSGSVVISSRTVIISLVAGTLVSVISAVFPRPPGEQGGPDCGVARGSGRPLGT